MRYLILFLLLAGCSSSHITIPPGAHVGNITVYVNKAVTTSPSLKADGNTVPISAVP